MMTSAFADARSATSSLDTRTGRSLTSTVKVTAAMLRSR
jgi:hypothetical protein